MSKREHVRRMICVHPGCNESARFTYETLAEMREACSRRREWRCARHTKPEEVLTPENLRREVTLTCERNEELGKNFWVGTSPLKSGFVFGDGYKAFAGDFQPGTTLTITAAITPPRTRPAENTEC